jgi:serine/threonine protein kinase
LFFQEYFPTTLANAETAKLFRLSSPSKMYESEQEATTIQALRFLAAELTLGLLFLHRHGIVHQDVKPANIMISEGGHAVIGEFGAASALPTIQVLGHKIDDDDDDDDDDPFEGRPCSPSCDVDKDGAMIYISIVLRPEDTVTFTALYAAPELLERKGNGSLIYDERVDWWSLGISLYEIITGGLPFHISSEDVSIGKGRSGGGDSGNGLVFDLLEGLDLTRTTTRACDAHLDGYLRSVKFFFNCFVFN